MEHTEISWHVPRIPPYLQHITSMWKESRERERERERERVWPQLPIHFWQQGSGYSESKVCLPVKHQKQNDSTVTEDDHTWWGHADHHHHHYPHWLLCCFSGVLLSGGEWVLKEQCKCQPASKQDPPCKCCLMKTISSKMVKGKACSIHVAISWKSYCWDDAGAEFSWSAAAAFAGEEVLDNDDVSAASSPLLSCSELMAPPPPGEEEEVLAIIIPSSPSTAPTARHCSGSSSSPPKILIETSAPPPSIIPPNLLLLNSRDWSRDSVIASSPSSSSTW